MKLHVLGIDLGKTVFHPVGLDSAGSVVIRKKCSRKQLLVFTANLQVQLIGMEACNGNSSNSGESVGNRQYPRWLRGRARFEIGLIHTSRLPEICTGYRARFSSATCRERARLL